MKVLRFDCTRALSESKNKESDRLTVIWSVLYIMGFHTMKENWKSNIRSTFCLMFMISFYINDLKNIYLRWTEGNLMLSEAVEMLTFIQTQGITLYRMYLLICHKDKFRLLVHYVNVEIPSWFTSPGLKSVIRKGFQRGSWIYILHIIQLIMVGLMLIIRPLVSKEPYALVMQKPMGRLPLIPNDRIPYYQITYLIQLLYMGTAICLAFCINMLYFTLSIKLCAYMEHLADDIDSITDRYDSNDVSKTLSVFINRYNRTGEFVDLFNDFFSIISSIQPLYAGVSIITSALVFDGTKQTVSFFGIAVAHTFELYIYCYVGDLISKKSCALGDRIFGSSWYNFSPRDKKTVLQILQKCQKPFTIQAGLFEVLTRYTFTNTMKTTYSIWTVLNQMKDKNNA